jgi:dipeptidase D
MGEYPAWEYRENSPLRDASVAAYEKLFGQTPEVVAIHAGLECGLLSEKLPGLDCISFGPQMHDIHTSREKLEIASVKRTWVSVQRVSPSESRATIAIGSPPKLKIQTIRYNI